MSGETSMLEERVAGRPRDVAGEGTPASGRHHAACSATASGPAWRERALTVVMFGLVLASVASWWLLVRDWGVLDHYDVPFFAFEKVPGVFVRTMLDRTRSTAETSVLRGGSEIV